MHILLQKLTSCLQVGHTLFTGILIHWDQTSTLAIENHSLTDSKEDPGGVFVYSYHNVHSPSPQPNIIH